MSFPVWFIIAGVLIGGASIIGSLINVRRAQKNPFDMLFDSGKSSVMSMQAYAAMGLYVASAIAFTGVAMLFQRAPLYAMITCITGVWIATAGAIYGAVNFQRLAANLQGLDIGKLSGQNLSGYIFVMGAMIAVIGFVLMLVPYLA